MESKVSGDSREAVTGAILCSLLDAWNWTRAAPSSRTDLSPLFLLLTQAITSALPIFFNFYLAHPPSSVPVAGTGMLGRWVSSV